jgi:hypothetical protein
MTAEQPVEHYPAQVGSTMSAEYNGLFITCSCQADRFGEGPRIPVREYPDHVLGALRELIKPAADLIREYVETGGQAHEVIRAHRALATALGEAAGA